MPKPYGKQHIASTHDCQGRKREASSCLSVNAELVARGGEPGSAPRCDEDDRGDAGIRKSDGGTNTGIAFRACSEARGRDIRDSRRTVSADRLTAHDRLEGRNRVGASQRRRDGGVIREYQAADTKFQSAGAVERSPSALDH